MAAMSAAKRKIERSQVLVSSPLPLFRCGKLLYGV
jgi:hypothetical protein